MPAFVKMQVPQEAEAMAAPLQGTPLRIAAFNGEQPDTCWIEQGDRFTSG